MVARGAAPSSEDQIRGRSDSCGAIVSEAEPGSLRSDDLKLAAANCDRPGSGNSHRGRPGQAFAYVRSLSMGRVSECRSLGRPGMPNGAPEITASWWWLGAANPPRVSGQALAGVADTRFRSRGGRGVQVGRRRCIHHFWWRSRSFDQPMAIAADILTDRICPAAEVDTPGDPHWLVDHGILLHILYRALESQIGMGLLISSPDNRLQAFVRRF